MKRNPLWQIVKSVIFILVVGVIYWIKLPPINLRSTQFYGFIIDILIAFAVVFGIGKIIEFIKDSTSKRGNTVNFKPHLPKGLFLKIMLGTIGAVVLVMIVGSVIGSPIFNASRYKGLLTYTEGDFSLDVAELSMNQIPVVDRDTASRLGKRKLGEMSDLVSQFEIAENYTQINYKGSPYRVTLLNYGDIIKWFNNREQGIPAYILVNMTTQETSLVRLSEGIKYSDSEPFLRNTQRALRFKYPTKIFDEVSFEIDDNGTPYWIAPTISYRIGIWSGRDISGAVLMNAVTGESEWYALSDIPSWVDQVFISDLVISQLNYNGLYQHGYWNSIFGQKDVLNTTEGYNYIAIGDDVYLYTGMTSVAQDESNVGFVLVNMRTKETKFYRIPGAEEYSAMDSAEGKVQQMNYESTFPILLNIAERPTYFMSLKDSAGLVKMYAFVDVEQYQIVGTGQSVEDAILNYENELESANVETQEKPTEYEDVSGVISEIYSAVKNGNTYYYFKLEGNETIYNAVITVSEELPFYKVGTELSFKADGGSVVSIE